MKGNFLKILVVLLSLSVFLGICYFIYDYHEGGTDYYIKVLSDPIDKQDAIDNKGNIQGTVYSYNMKGIDKNNNIQDILFTVNKERPLKKNAFIKVRLNPNKGSISWKEVQEDEIPDSIIHKIT